MTKTEALQEFWASFGLKAYDENTVPDNAELPYITYSAKTDSIGSVLALTGSVWYRSPSWKEIDKKVEQIARGVAEKGFFLNKVDGGYLWITKGRPFAQRMAVPEDDMMRRVYLVFNGEFITAY